MNQSIDFAIVTPLEEERAAMLSQFPATQRVSSPNGSLHAYYSVELPVCQLDGEKGTYSIILSDLLSTGRVDAAIVVKDILRTWNPRFVILTGIAGGFGRAGVKIGDVIIADQIIDAEHQKWTPAGREVSWSVHRVHVGLLVAAKELWPEHWQPKTGRPEEGTSRRHIGPICTGDKVVADGSLDDVAKHWPRLVGVEMEAGGAASAAYQAEPAPGFFMVRGVSDLADANKDAVRTQAWRSYACNVAATFVLALLKSAPVPFERSRRDSNSRKSETALKCPKCGKKTMIIHSRSESEFVLICSTCSTTGFVTLDGTQVIKYIVPGVITLLGIVAINAWLQDNHYGSVLDALLDLADHVPDWV